jgi:transcriptional regulator with XRE-family HTH domain
MRSGRIAVTLLGEAIKEYRRARALSLRDVAGRSGLSKAHVWDIECGCQKNPTVESVCRLAVAFSVTPDELLGFAVADCTKRLEDSGKRLNSSSCCSERDAPKSRVIF